MLAYAANAPRHAERRSSPNAMLAIVAVHVALLAAVMSAKMDLPKYLPRGPIDIFWVPTPKTPPPQPIRTAGPQHQSQLTTATHEQAEPTTDLMRNIDVTPVFQGPGDLTPSNPDPHPTANPIPGPTIAQLLTPLSELKPPYPQSKLLAEEEAVLKLRLTIDAGGRVVAVDPVGRADPVFLDAARRYLTAHWRYKPATEAGRAVASTLIITLQFQLDG